MVFISKGKLHVSAYSGHLQVLTILAENCQNLKMAAIGRNMYNLAINLQLCFSTEFTSP